MQTSPKIIFSASSLNSSKIGRSGFSLIELLIVIAIIAIMTTLGVPAIASLGKASSLTRATTDLALSFEQARAYAMANSTYVWVGLNQNTSDQLSLAVVAGANGQQTDINSSANYRLISRTKTFDNVKLNSNLPSTVPGMSENVANITQSSIGGSLKAKVGGQDRNFSQIVQFSPAGEAIVSSSSLPRWVQVGLSSATGSADNFSVLQISALTGQVRIFRP